MSGSKRLSHKKSDKYGRTINYHGYSKNFIKIKQLLCQGKAEEVGKIYDQEDEKISEKCNTETELAHKIGFLGLLERGILAVDRGDPKDAEQKFFFAEQVLNNRTKESKFAEGFKKGFIFVAETLTGVEELNPYKGEPYEDILMLNYKSIAYLLQGDRRAYNVTRRAIDWQNMAKKEFEKKVRKAKSELEKKQKEQKDKNQDVSDLKIEETITKQYSHLEALANRVPSAYVNPFGYYIAGIIQEYDSYNDPSLRHNALISYKKALELNPDSQVIKQTIKDIEKNQNNNNQDTLLQVIIGDGFVPEKKVLSYLIKLKDTTIPIKLPIYEPVPTKVRRIELQTEEGKMLARLSSVADIEAICLRHQKDMQPFYTLRVFLSVGRSILEKGLLHKTGVFGSVISSLHDQVSAPDTRSWMSLPASIKAARLHIPKELKTIRIVNYDQNGKELASETVSLESGTHNFIYGRSIDNVLHAYKSRDLWIAEN